jgi:hypothetical protein
MQRVARVTAVRRSKEQHLSADWLGKDSYEQYSSVPTAVRGVFDYVGAIGLIASPFIFRFFSMGGIAVVSCPSVLRAGLILYSLLTTYELGVPALRVIPIPVHLTVDFVAFALLVVAPFLFGYCNEGLNVRLPQVIAGVAVIRLVLVSQTEPQFTNARRSVRFARARQAHGYPRAGWLE